MKDEYGLQELGVAAPNPADTTLYVVSPEQITFEYVGPELLKRLIEYSEEHSDGLYLEFAQTETASQAILRFAEKHGLLGNAEENEGRVGEILPLLGVDGHQRRMAYAEPVEVWKSEINELRKAIQLFKLCRDRNPLEQANYILSDDHGLVKFLETTPKKDWSGMDDIVDDARAYIDGMPYTRGWKEDRRERERKRVEHMLAEHLGGTFTSILERKLGSHSKQAIKTDDTFARFGLHITPRNLLGTLWLQFASAVFGQRDFRRCQHCGAWFATTEKVRGSEQLYCDRRCQMKAYRGRREKA